MINVVSFGGLAINDGVSYAAHLDGPHSQPSRDVVMIERGEGWPVAGAVRRGQRELVLDVTIVDRVTADASRLALYRALDTDAAAKALVVSDGDGVSNLRYLMCLVSHMVEAENESGTGLRFVVRLVVTKEAMWRAVTPAAAAWSITASGQTKVITNAGHLDAYPTYTITPTAAKTTGTVYKKFVAVGYQGPVIYEQMPVRLSLNTAALVAAGKVAAEANLAVYVNGKEVRRWLTGWNTSDTGVWVNMDFGPGRVGVYSGLNSTPNTAMLAGDTVTNLVLSSDLSNWPSEGVVKVDNTEAFAYQGIDRAYKTLLNVQRAYGFTAAGHAVGAVVVLVQHNVELVYGAGVTAATAFADDVYPDGAMVPYDDRKPILDLANSSNFVWRYYQAFNEVFDDQQARFRPRTGRWTPRAPTANVSLVLGVPPSGSTIAMLMGLQIDAPLRKRQQGAWSLKLPRGLNSVVYAGYGNYVRPERVTGSSAELWQGRLWSGTQTVENQIVGFALPVNVDGDPDQNSYAMDYAGTAGAVGSAGHSLTLDLAGQGQLVLALDQITLNFETVTSFVAAGVEVASYTLSAVMTNVTTGESITVRLPMVIGEDLVINTAERTVLYQGANQYQAFQRDSVRLPWLRLAPGANTLQWTEANVAGMDVGVVFEERYY